MSGVPTREVARRVFATEFNDAHHTFSESNDERAPTYLLLPTGAQANRAFVVGTLTETEDVGDESEYWRGRVVDPTGTFFVYAGQYQPDAASVLREIEPPAYVAVVGKPRTYETDDGTVNVSLRPESIAVVDAETRDRWVVETAEQSLDRIDHAREVGTSDEYVAMADERYGLDLDGYRSAVVSALEGLESDAAEGTDGAAAESASDTADESGEGEAEPIEPNAD